MENVHILMLGWENPVAPAVASKPWLSAALAQAAHSKVHLLLPRCERAPGSANIRVTDLSQSKLPDRTYQEIAPENLPYGPAPFPGMTIPLYGTQVYTGNAAPRMEPLQPGEAVTAGYPGSGLDQASQRVGAASSSADLQQQVIDYARKACRFAHHLPFGEIYALQWQTYLAALELKTITGKKLVVRYRAVNQKNYPQMNWIGQLEKQVIEKADVLLVDKEGLAVCLAKEYGSAPGKFHLLPVDTAPADKILPVEGCQVQKQKGMETGSKAGFKIQPLT